MDLIQIYQCLCDETRLRIIHLLSHAPLCVCHFQDVLGESQVKISKHLTYLKSRGLVESRKHQNWRVYSLPEEKSPELQLQLRCLQDCVHEKRMFREDLKRLKSVTQEASKIAAQCCENSGKRPQKNNCC